MALDRFYSDGRRVLTNNVGSVEGWQCFSVGSERSSRVQTFRKCITTPQLRVRYRVLTVTTCPSCQVLSSAQDYPQW